MFDSNTKITREDYALATATLLNQSKRSFKIFECSNGNLKKVAIPTNLIIEVKQIGVDPNQATIFYFNGKRVTSVETPLSVEEVINRISE